MHDEKLFSAGRDPLRYIDARFEPVDPIFDAEEPALPFFRRRKPRSGAAAAAAIAASLACGGGSQQVAPAPDAILVQLERGAAPPAGTARQEGGPPIVPLQAVSSDDGEAPLLRVPIDPGENPAAAAEQAAARAGVAFAEPIYVYPPRRVPNDARYGDLWGLEKIAAPAAWTRTTGERGVVVAVVDDGVALDHPDLAPNIWRNPSELEGNRQDDDGDGFVNDVNGWDFVDDDGDPAPAASGEERWHGTHVAGTIGAAGDNRIGVAGVSWKVSLMALRAIGPSGGRSDHLAKAIDFASEHGARVINASWGGNGSSQVIASAIARASRKGVLFVAAAGNESAASPSFPANLRLDNIISVGATGPDDRLAAFSDRGAMVAAPGVGILSTTAPGRYESYDGTSMAAPHVAGIAALLWAAHPQASVAQVRKAILGSTVPVRGVQHGRVDASRALAALDRETTPDAPALRLSRDALAFAVRYGRLPRAQTITIHTEGGGSTPFTATADAKWVLLSKTEAETPARFSVRIDPAAMAPGRNEAHVSFAVDGKAAARLTVAAQVGSIPIVSVQGDGCELRDGAVHARAGAGCAVASADGDTAEVRWVLPDGAQVAGGRLYGQFVRRGEFEMTLSSDDGVTDAVPVVIE
jgi:subtilisin family serine protease